MARTYAVRRRPPEEDDLGSVRNALDEGVASADQFAPPDPDEAIPSPYTDDDSMYTRQAILDRFNPEKKPTNTGISGQGTPYSREGRNTTMSAPGYTAGGDDDREEWTQEQMLLGLHNRPGVRPGSYARDAEEDAELMAAEDAEAAGDESGEETDTLPDETAPTRPRGNNPNSTDTQRWAGSDPSFFGGFDFQRDQNPNKSAKDRFAELAGASGVNPAEAFSGEGGKQRAEEWFNQYILPGLLESGYEVDWVKGDQAYIRSWDGEGAVDFVTQAGGDNPDAIKFAWQPQTGGEGGGGGGMGGGFDSMMGIDALGSSDMLAQIMAALNELAGEGENPALVQALLQQLGGGGGVVPNDQEVL